MLRSHAPKLCRAPCQQMPEWLLLQHDSVGAAQPPQPRSCPWRSPAGQPDARAAADPGRQAVRRAGMGAESSQHAERLRGAHRPRVQTATPDLPAHTAARRCAPSPQPHSTPARRHLTASSVCIHLRVHLQSAFMSISLRPHCDSALRTTITFLLCTVTGTSVLTDTVLTDGMKISPLHAFYLLAAARSQSGGRGSLLAQCDRWQRCSCHRERPEQARRLAAVLGAVPGRRAQSDRTSLLSVSTIEPGCWSNAWLRHRTGVGCCSAAALGGGPDRLAQWGQGTVGHALGTWACTPGALLTSRTLVPVQQVLP